LIPNPIHKVLSSMRAHRVRALLMGGQACVFYGAAEFSRDVDFAILADVLNLARLRKVLAGLQAEVIAVPPFEIKFLRRGHAVDSFAKLWRRRTTIEISGGEKYDLLSLPDLVQAKKTQRDKDWPMIRRLVEANYFENQARPTAAQIRFWLLKLRTPEWLVELTQRTAVMAQKLSRKRPLLRHAMARDFQKLEKALQAEESAERENDRRYWQPLKKELEKIRHGV